MVTIKDYNLAHKVVDSNKSLFWDGWTIVEFKPHPDAITHKSAIYRNNRWGFTKRFEPSTNGWKVPDKYVR
jgi:hypothetical protein